MGSEMCIRDSYYIYGTELWGSPTIAAAAKALMIAIGLAITRV